MSERQLSSGELVESLTQREQAILQHLVVGMTYREIAKQEVLALNTVKWFVQQVYGKLGVNNRRQAQDRAREMGLIAAKLPASQSPNEPTHLSRRSFPTGTVTFLFTDIVGSTSLWEGQPELMAEALEIHNTALRGVIEVHGGIVFKTVGDAFQAAFATAQQALQAAIVGQRALQSAAWNELGELQVRMGLHTGEAELDPGGDEYAVSHTKNRIGRIHTAAHGGQILLSAETKELVDRHLPEGVILKDLGENRLKGMQWLEHLYQVCTPDLRQNFPPLATTLTHPNNLPIQVTSFIGREKELAAVHRLLDSHRLVTLTGSGGTGKSRLSLQVATQLLERFPNGVWLVELAPLADPDLIPKTVASALNLPEIPGKTITQALVDFLRPKRLLLVLDNCEHLLEACADLADQLFQACPELTILASSREFLGVEGEVPYRVPPMSLPDARHLPPLEALSDYDAVRLFVERAQLAAADFTLGAENAGTVAQVVSRLDGIPLAIELAASRLRVLGIDQIAQRLDDTFRLLTGGSRSRLPRHQTLRACIDWSYNLLSEPERILLRRLSVFAGSWRLRAAEQVCAQASEDGQPLYPQDILDLLSELVDKSLISPVSGADGRNRFRMLETVRQYAHEKLVDEGESEAVRDRHLAYYLALADDLEPKYRSPYQIETLEQTEIELDNFRLALEWGLQTNIQAELRIAADLMWFWHIRSYWSEGIKWLERGLEIEMNSPPAETDADWKVIRARALSGTGFLFLMLRLFQGIETDQIAKITLYLEESAALLRAAKTSPETKRWLAWALLWRGFNWSEDDFRNKFLVLEALDLFRQVGDAHGTAECLVALGYLEYDLTLARKLHQEQLAVDEANGDVEGIATALFHLGWVDFCDGYYAEARLFFERSLEQYVKVKNQNSVGYILTYLGLSAQASGELVLARKYVKQGIAILGEIGKGNFYLWGLYFLSLLEMAEGRFDQAEEINERLWCLALEGNFEAQIAAVFYNRARLARLNKDLKMAQKLAEEALVHSFGHIVGRYFHETELVLIKIEQGNLAEAGGQWREVLKAMQGREKWSSLIDTLAILAKLEGKLEQAAKLFGSRWCRGQANFLSPIEKASREADCAAVREELGEARFEALYEEGKSVTYQQFIDLAQEVISG